MRFACSLRVLSASLLLLCAPACGGDDEGGTDGDAPATLECGGSMECDTATQYCVTSRLYANDESPGYFCLAKPESCTDCDCIDAEADFLAEYESNNCSQAVITCSSDNGAISVECQRSSSF